MASSTASPRETVVAEPAWAWTLVWVGFPLAGVGVALGLVALADWVVSLPWAPLQGVFRLIDSWSGLPLTVGASVVGAVTGLLLAATGWDDRLTVTVAPDRATLVRGGTSRQYDRTDVRTVFVDRKHLVLLDRAGGELAREKSDLDRAALQQAFEAHGYGWTDEDPYAGEFRLWVDGADGLPPGGNALLKARARDLDDQGKDAVELRRELARIGVVVRDDDGRQYWRRVDA